MIATGSCCFSQSSQPGAALTRGPGEAVLPHGSTRKLPPRFPRIGVSVIAIHPDTGWLGSAFTGGSARRHVLVVPPSRT